MSEKSNITAAYRGGLRTGRALIGKADRPAPLTITVMPGYRAEPTLSEKERAKLSREREAKLREENRAAQRHAKAANLEEQKNRPDPYTVPGSFGLWGSRR